MTRVGRRGFGERGAVAVEFALAVPLLMLLFGLVVGGARVWLARSSVEAMAAAGARAASIARSPVSAESQAKALVTAQSTTAGLRCSSLHLDVDARVLATPPGTPGQVSVGVTCRVPLADVIVPGWPGELAVQAQASSVVGQYRGRR